MSHKEVIIMVENEKVDIRRLKEGFSTRFPNSKLTSVLLRLPDELPKNTLPGVVDVWTAILDSEVES